MKRQFQSKAVPRGTRTIWRYLGALFILFTFAIGNVWAADVAYSAEMGGTTTGNESVNIHTNTDSQTAIAKFANSCIANGVLTNYWKISGTFKAGDVISFTGVYNNSKTKETAIAIYASDKTQLFKSAACINGRTSADDPEVQTYTLLEDYDELYLGRDGSTGTFLLTFSITREGGSDPEPTDMTAPAFVSAIPANSATDVAVSGNIVLTFSEAIASVDASKFTLTGATKGTVAIDGTDAKKVNVGYTAENEASVTLAVAAEAVADAAGNKSAALSNISFTTVAAAPTPAEKDGIKMVENGALTGKFRINSSQLKSGSYTVEGIDYTKYVQLSSSSSSLGGETEGAQTKGIYYAPQKKNVKFWFYMRNTDSSAKTINIVIMEEGKSASSKSVSVPVGSQLVSYDLAIDKNAEVVFMVNSTKLYYCQIVAVESGDALLQGGEVGYVFNYAGKRQNIAANTLRTIDHVDYYLSAESKINSGSNVQLTTLGTHYIKFHLNARTKVSIECDNKPYKIGTSKSGETAQIYSGQDDGAFNLTEGDWYINGAGETVKITKLEFLEPDAAYAVTYNAGEGSVKSGKSLPTHADAIKDEVITLASGENLEKEGYDFTGWKANGTGDLLLAGAEYTMGSAPVEFVAQWDVHVAKYGVKFMDGEEKLDSLSVTLGQAPSFANPTKALHTFTSWRDGEDHDIALSDLAATVAKEDSVVVLYARWAKAYASTVNFADDNNTGSLASFLPAGYACGGTFSNSTWGKESEGADFFGYKLKDKNVYVEFRIPANQRATILFGNYGATGTIKVGDAEAVECTLTESQYVVDAEEEKVIRFTTNATSGSTVTLKSITIGDIPALSDVATLSGLEIDGAAVEGFSAAQTIIYKSVPYGTAVADMPKITGATVTEEHATYVISPETAPEWNEQNKCYLQQVIVTAQNGTSKGFYHVRTLVEPKYGVCLIKGNVSNNAIARDNASYLKSTEVTLQNSGVNGKDPDVDTGSKFQQGSYIQIELPEGKTFKTGDMLVVNVTKVTSDKLRVFKSSDNTEANIIGESAANMTVGVNYVLLTEDARTLYLKRGSDATHYKNWNPHVTYVAVYRYMAPFIESFEIAGVEDFVINQDLKTITASVANTFDVTALTPTVKYWGNGGGAIDKTGAQNFTNPVQYTVSSAYSEDATGDYAPVTYTVTITKVVPSVEPTITTQPQGANYYEGASIAALTVAAESTAGELSYQWQVKNGLAYDDIEGATAATYAPAVSAIGSYVYRVVVTNTEESKPATSVNSEDAIIVIDEDPAAIKLIVDGTSGKEVNTTNYITGVTASKVTIGTTEYDCVTFAGTVGSSVAASNMKYLNRHVTYNATTTQTKVKLHLYNNSDNKRTIYVQGVIEGNTSTGDIVNLLTLQLNGKEEKTTDYIEFNNAKNRSIYVFVSSDAGDIKILQEKVIESGEPLKKAGDSGYSLNMNKGRMFGAQGATIAFEGMTYTLNGDYAPVSSTVLKVKSNNIVFVAAAPTLMKVTTANDKTYYVTKDAAGEDNETAKTGVSEFDLTAGTWYITAGGSEVQFTKIEFVAPKCAEPQFNALQNSDICAGDPYVSLDGTATVADAGTPIYQWYKAEGDVEIEGATNETYTPTADGSYYVIATNQLAGYTDNVKKSATVTVTTYASAAITTAPESQRKEAGQNATLTVEATGKAPLTYQWYTCDVNGDNAIIIDGAEAATYQVEVTAGMSQYYKVVVGSGCGSAEAVALVAEWHEVAPANVTGSITWDWAGSAWSGISGDIAFANTGVEELMANVSSKVPVSDAGNFRADMLYGTGQYVWRSSNKFFQGTKIRFITEVPGFLTVHYRNTSGSTNTRRIEVVNNGETLAEDGTSTTNNWKWTNKVFVQAGEVILNGIASEANGLTRIDQIVFNANPDYTRNVSNNIGTLCVDHNVPAGQYLGATFYQIASRNETYPDKIDFEEVLPNEELKAGEPYIFQSTTGKIELFYGATVADAPVAVRGMHGWFDATAPIDPTKYDMLDITGDNMSDILYISQNKLWSCENLLQKDLKVVNNRAYIVMSEVKTYEEYEASKQNNGAPRRRVTMGRNGEQSATGFENLNASEKPMKLMINGQIFILRGEKMFDATGRLVK